MHSQLHKIVQAKYNEIESLKQQRVGGGSVLQPVTNLQNSLQQSGLSVIAEIKRCSPSKGQLATIADPAALAQTYYQAGAQAVSVLTDQHFDGHLNDLYAVSQALQDSPCSVLRKDFILDPIQIVESRYYGADAVLLIVGLLQERTATLLQYCRDYGLQALVEVHTQDELAIALQAGADIIGINNRDLDTFEVDPQHALQLIPYMPETVTRVAESGVSDVKLAQQYAQAGFDAVLVGESLVRSSHPGALIQTLQGHSYDATSC